MRCMHVEGGEDVEIDLKCIVSEGGKKRIMNFGLMNNWSYIRSPPSSIVFRDPRIYFTIFTMLDGEKRSLIGEAFLPDEYDATAYSPGSGVAVVGDADDEAVKTLNSLGIIANFVDDRVIDGRRVVALANTALGEGEVLNPFNMVWLLFWDMDYYLYIDYYLGHYGILSAVIHPGGEIIQFYVNYTKVVKIKKRRKEVSVEAAVYYETRDWSVDWSVVESELAKASDKKIAEFVVKWYKEVYKRRLEEMKKYAKLYLVGEKIP